MARPRKEPRLVRVFLATPRDTTEERVALRTAVDTVNRTTGGNESFRVDLLHWTTDTYSAVGPDAQTLVNTQVGEYDLLVVVLNQQFGTRTARASSGTEEEYDRAFLRYLQQPLSIQILAYFADPLVRLHSVDPVALGQIKQFRARLEREGVLYGVYKDTQDFERIVTYQLTRACRDFLAGSRRSKPSRRASVDRREELRHPKWVAESRPVLPQSANYTEIDLTPYRGAAVSLYGAFRSQSPYFRFGFKLSGLRQPLFGDGSIQTPDPNLVFHIGKNRDGEGLFYTVYRNGRRVDRDHELLGAFPPGASLLIGLSVSVNNVVSFEVNGATVFEDRLPSESRERLALLMWADEHECRVEFDDILMIADFPH